MKALLAAILIASPVLASPPEWLGTTSNGTPKVVALVGKKTWLGVQHWRPRNGQKVRFPGWTGTALGSAWPVHPWLNERSFVAFDLVVGSLTLPAHVEPVEVHWAEFPDGGFPVRYWNGSTWRDTVAVKVGGFGGSEFEFDAVEGDLIVKGYSGRPVLFEGRLAGLMIAAIDGGARARAVAPGPIWRLWPEAWARFPAPEPVVSRSEAGRVRVDWGVPDFGWTLQRSLTLREWLDVDPSGITTGISGRTFEVNPSRLEAFRLVR